jgi:hypothetical protein
LKNKGGWVVHGKIGVFKQQVDACRGVAAYFELVLIKLGGWYLLPIGVGESGSWSFLQVGACKLGGWCLLPVDVGKSWKLVLPVNVIFKIYILKQFCGFLPFGFPHKNLMYCV